MSSRKGNNEKCSWYEFCPPSLICCPLPPPPPPRYFYPETTDAADKCCSCYDSCYRCQLPPRYGCCVCCSPCCEQRESHFPPQTSQFFDPICCSSAADRFDDDSGSTSNDNSDCGSAVSSSGASLKSCSDVTIKNVEIEAQFYVKQTILNDDGYPQHTFVPYKFVCHPTAVLGKSKSRRRDKSNSESRMSSKCSKKTGEASTEKQKCSCSKPRPKDIKQKHQCRSRLKVENNGRKTACSVRHKKLDRNERKNSDKEVKTDTEDCDESQKQAHADDNESGCPQYNKTNDDCECEGSSLQSIKSDDSDCEGSSHKSGTYDDTDCEGPSQQNVKNDESDCEESSQQNVKNDDSDCEESSQQNVKNDESDCEESSQQNIKNDDSDCEESSQQNVKNDDSDCGGSEQRVNTNDQGYEHLDPSVDYDECDGSQHKQKISAAKCNGSNAAGNTKKLNNNSTNSLKQKPPKPEKTLAECHKPHQNNDHATQIHQTSEQELEIVKSGDQERSQGQPKVENDVPTYQKLQKRAREKTRTGSQNPQKSYKNVKCNKTVHDPVEQKSETVGSQELQKSHPNVKSSGNVHDPVEQKSETVGSQEPQKSHLNVKANGNVHDAVEQKSETNGSQEPQKSQKVPQSSFDKVNAHNETCSQIHHSSPEESQANEKNYDSAHQNSENLCQSVVTEYEYDECNCSQHEQEIEDAECNDSNENTNELNNNLTNSLTYELQARENMGADCHKPLQQICHATQLHLTSTLTKKHELKTVKSGKQDGAEMLHQVKKDAQTHRNSSDAAMADEEFYNTKHQNIQVGCQEPRTVHKNAHSDKNGHDAAKQKIEAVDSQEPQISYEEENAHEIDHDHDTTQQKVKQFTRELDESKKKDKMKDKKRDLMELKTDTDAVDRNNWTREEAETGKHSQYKLKTDSREFDKWSNKVEKYDEDCHKIQRELYNNCQVNQHSNKGGKVKAEDKTPKQTVKINTSRRRMTTDEDGVYTIRQLDVQTDTCDGNNSLCEMNTNRRSHHKAKNDTLEFEKKSDAKVKTAEKTQGDALRRETTNKVGCGNDSNIESKRLHEKLHQAAGNNISNEYETCRDITNTKQLDRNPVTHRKRESKRKAHVLNTAHEESICKTNSEGVQICDKSCQTTSKWLKCSKSRHLKPSREASCTNSIVTSDVTTSSSRMSYDDTRRSKGHKHQGRATRSTARVRHLPSSERPEKSSNESDSSCGATCRCKCGRRRCADTDETDADSNRLISSPSAIWSDLNMSANNGKGRITEADDNDKDTKFVREYLRQIPGDHRFIDGRQPLSYVHHPTSSICYPRHPLQHSSTPSSPLGFNSSAASDKKRIQVELGGNWTDDGVVGSGRRGHRELANAVTVDRRGTTAFDIERLLNNRSTAKVDPAELIRLASAMRAGELTFDRCDELLPVRARRIPSGTDSGGCQRSGSPVRNGSGLVGCSRATGGDIGCVTMGDKQYREGGSVTNECSGIDSCGGCLSVDLDKMASLLAIMSERLRGEDKNKKTTQAMSIKSVKDVWTPSAVQCDSDADSLRSQQQQQQQQQYCSHSAATRIKRNERMSDRSQSIITSADTRLRGRDPPVDDCKSSCPVMDEYTPIRHADDGRPSASRSDQNSLSPKTESTHSSVLLVTCSSGSTTRDEPISFDVRNEVSAGCQQHLGRRQSSFSENSCEIPSIDPSGRCSSLESFPPNRDDESRCRTSSSRTELPRQHHWQRRVGERTSSTCGGNQRRAATPGGSATSSLQSCRNACVTNSMSDCSTTSTTGTEIRPARFGICKSGAMSRTSSTIIGKSKSEGSIEEWMKQWQLMTAAEKDINLVVNSKFDEDNDDDGECHDDVPSFPSSRTSSRLMSSRHSSTIRADRGCSDVECELDQSPDALEDHGHDQYHGRLTLEECLKAVSPNHINRPGACFCVQIAGRQFECLPCRLREFFREQSAVEGLENTKDDTAKTHHQFPIATSTEYVATLPVPRAVKTTPAAESNAVHASTDKTRSSPGAHTSLRSTLLSEGNTLSSTNQRRSCVYVSPSSMLMAPEYIQLSDAETRQTYANQLALDKIRRNARSNYSMMTSSSLAVKNDVTCPSHGASQLTTSSRSMIAAARQTCSQLPADAVDSNTSQRTGDLFQTFDEDRTMPTFRPSKSSAAVDRVDRYSTPTTAPSRVPAGIISATVIQSSKPIRTAQKGKKYQSNIPVAVCRADLSRDSHLSQNECNNLYSSSTENTFENATGNHSNSTEQWSTETLRCSSKFDDPSKTNLQRRSRNYIDDNRTLPGVSPTSTDSGATDGSGWLPAYWEGVTNAPENIHSQYGTSNLDEQQLALSKQPSGQLNCITKRLKCVVFQPDLTPPTSSELSLSESYAVISEMPYECPSTTQVSPSPSETLLDRESCVPLETSYRYDGRDESSDEAETQSFLTAWPSPVHIVAMESSSSCDASTFLTRSDLADLSTLRDAIEMCEARTGSAPRTTSYNDIVNDVVDDRPLEVSTELPRLTPRCARDQQKCLITRPDPTRRKNRSIPRLANSRAQHGAELTPPPKSTSFTKPTDQKPTLVDDHSTVTPSCDWLTHQEQSTSRHPSPPSPPGHRASAACSIELQPRVASGRKPVPSTYQNVPASLSSGTITFDDLATSPSSEKVATLVRRSNTSSLMKSKGTAPLSETLHLCHMHEVEKEQLPVELRCSDASVEQSRLSHTQSQKPSTARPPMPSTPLLSVPLNVTLPESKRWQTTAQHPNLLTPVCTFSPASNTITYEYDKQVTGGALQELKFARGRSVSPRSRPPSDGNRDNEEKTTRRRPSPSTLHRMTAKSAKGITCVAPDGLRNSFSSGKPGEQVRRYATTTQPCAPSRIPRTPRPSHRVSSPKQPAAFQTSGCRFPRAVDAVADKYLENVTGGDLHELKLVQGRSVVPRVPVKPPSEKTSCSRRTAANNIAPSSAHRMTAPSTNDTCGVASNTLQNNFPAEEQREQVRRQSITSHPSSISRPCRMPHSDIDSKPAEQPALQNSGCGFTRSSNASLYEYSEHVTGGTLQELTFARGRSVSHRISVPPPSEASRDFEEKSVSSRPSVATHISPSSEHRVTAQPADDTSFVDSDGLVNGYFPEEQRDKSRRQENTSQSSSSAGLPRTPDPYSEIRRAEQPAFQTSDCGSSRPSYTMQYEYGEHDTKRTHQELESAQGCSVSPRVPMPTPSYENRDTESKTVHSRPITSTNNAPSRVNSANKRSCDVLNGLPNSFSSEEQREQVLRQTTALQSPRTPKPISRIPPPKQSVHHTPCCGFSRTADAIRCDVGVAMGGTLQELKLVRGRSVVPQVPVKPQSGGTRDSEEKTSCCRRTAATNITPSSVHMMTAPYTDDTSGIASDSSQNNFSSEEQREQVRRQSITSHPSSISRPCRMPHSDIDSKPPAEQPALQTSGCGFTRSPNTSLYEYSEHVTGGTLQELTFARGRSVSHRISVPPPSEASRDFEEKTVSSRPSVATHISPSSSVHIVTAQPAEDMSFVDTSNGFSPEEQRDKSRRHTNTSHPSSPRTPDPHSEKRRAEQPAFQTSGGCLSRSANAASREFGGNATAGSLQDLKVTKCCTASYRGAMPTPTSAPNRRPLCRPTPPVSPTEILSSSLHDIRCTERRPFVVSQSRDLGLPSTCSMEFDYLAARLNTTGKPSIGRKSSTRMSPVQLPPILFPPSTTTLDRPSLSPLTVNILHATHSYTIPSCVHHPSTPATPSATLNPSPSPTLPSPTSSNYDGSLPLSNTTPASSRCTRQMSPTQAVSRSVSSDSSGRYAPMTSSSCASSKPSHNGFGTSMRGPDSETTGHSASTMMTTQRQQCPHHTAMNPSQQDDHHRALAASTKQRLEQLNSRRQEEHIDKNEMNGSSCTSPTLSDARRVDQHRHGPPSMPVFYTTLASYRKHSHSSLTRLITVEETNHRSPVPASRIEEGGVSSVTMRELDTNGSDLSHAPHDGCLNNHVLSPPSTPSHSKVIPVESHFSRQMAVETPKSVAAKLSTSAAKYAHRPGTCQHGCWRGINSPSEQLHELDAPSTDACIYQSSAPGFSRPEINRVTRGMCDVTSGCGTSCKDDEDVVETYPPGYFESVVAAESTAPHHVHPCTRVLPNSRLPVSHAKAEALEESSRQITSGASSLIRSREEHPQITSTACGNNMSKATIASSRRACVITNDRLPMETRPMATDVDITLNKGRQAAETSQSRLFGKSRALPSKCLRESRESIADGTSPTRRRSPMSSLTTSSCARQPATPNHSTPLHSSAFPPRAPPPSHPRTLTEPESNPARELIHPLNGLRAQSRGHPPPLASGQVSTENRLQVMQMEPVIKRKLNRASCNCHVTCDGTRVKRDQHVSPSSAHEVGSLPISDSTLAVAVSLQTAVTRPISTGSTVTGNEQSSRHSSLGSNVGVKYVALDRKLAREALQSQAVRHKTGNDQSKKTIDSRDPRLSLRNSHLQQRLPLVTKHELVTSAVEILCSSDCIACHNKPLEEPASRNTEYRDDKTKTRTVVTTAFTESGNSSKMIPSSAGGGATSPKKTSYVDIMMRRALTNSGNSTSISGHPSSKHPQAATLAREADAKLGLHGNHVDNQVLPFPETGHPSLKHPQAMTLATGNGAKSCPHGNNVDNQVLSFPGTGHPSSKHPQAATLAREADAKLGLHGNHVENQVLPFPETGHPSLKHPQAMTLATGNGAKSCLHGNHVDNQVLSFPGTGHPSSKHPQAITLARENNAKSYIHGNYMYNHVPSFSETLHKNHTAEIVLDVGDSEDYGESMEATTTALMTSSNNSGNSTLRVAKTNSARASNSASEPPCYFDHDNKTSLLRSVAICRPAHVLSNAGNWNGKNKSRDCQRTTLSRTATSDLRGLTKPSVKEVVTSRRGNPDVRSGTVQRRNATSTRNQSSSNGGRADESVPQMTSRPLNIHGAPANRKAVNDTSVPKFPASDGRVLELPPQDASEVSTKDSSDQVWSTATFVFENDDISMPCIALAVSLPPKGLPPSSSDPSASQSDVHTARLKLPTPTNKKIR